jgi:dTDP-glucose 4,6-dehydratase
MLILVTGGLGAVGSYLVRELRGRGHDVWINDLRHHHDAKYLRGDVGDYRQLEHVVTHKKFDVVYHLAAEFGRWNGEDFYETMWTSNVIGTKNLLRLQEKHRFRQVFFSSSEVYGDYEGTMAEDVMDKVEIKQMNDYALSKWVGEQQVQNSTTMHGTESVRVRLFNTYGPGEPPSTYRSVICRFVYAALKDLPYTVYLGHTRTSTYITDMCATLANICERFKPGEVYNIAGTDYHDIKGVSDLILRVAGKTDALVTYTESEPFTTKHKKVDGSKAVRDLAHAPKVKLEQGIVETVSWMKQYIAQNP